eukprot:134815-Amphidinium_carterae.1
MLFCDRPKYIQTVGGSFMGVIDQDNISKNQNLERLFRDNQLLTTGSAAIVFELCFVCASQHKRQHLRLVDSAR